MVNGGCLFHESFNNLSNFFKSVVISIFSPNLSANMSIQLPPKNLVSPYLKIFQASVQPVRSFEADIMEICKNVK